MKKLIVAMCAAMIGLATQAGTVSWSFSWATDASGNDLTSGTAYLMAESVMSKSAADAALTAKTFDTAKALGDTSIVTDAAKGAHGGADTTVSLTGSQSFYVVLVSGDNYGITASTTKTIATVGPTSVPFYELSDDSGVSSLTWKPGGISGGSGGGGGGSGGVPEPTSGLLLLVGGAMLALRRKQK